MVATKTKQQVISKRQLLALMERFNACNFWKNPKRTKGTVTEIFERSFRLGHGLGWLWGYLGKRPPLYEVYGNRRRTFTLINRAALAYCRKHGIK